MTRSDAKPGRDHVLLVGPLCARPPEAEASEAYVAADLPLGVLTVAACLREAGVEAAMLDLSQIHREHSASGSRRQSEFIDRAASAILADDPGVIGIGTICSSYPSTLELAEELRRRRPDVPILLGGPQASAVAKPTLEAFSAVDVIVRGEAELSTPALVAALREGRPLDDVPGISYRRDGGVVHTPAAPLITDLAELPTPAYDLYPHALRGVVRLPIEAGRGCPYACSFCSTSIYFSRRFRMKRPERLLAEMDALAAAYDVHRFEMVHDMFTADRRVVGAICDVLIAADRGYEWGCSARTDSMTAELARKMRAAGCAGVFFGVETGSKRLQGEIEKDLSLDEAREVLVACDSADLDTTCSLIVGYPEERVEDCDDTIAFAADVARHDSIHLQVHLLSPLPDAPLMKRFGDQLLFDRSGTTSDIGITSGFELEPHTWQLVETHPEVFSTYYLYPCLENDRERLLGVYELARAALMHFRLLMVALHDQGVRSSQLLERWQREHPPGWRPSADDVRASFLDFVERAVLPELPRGDVIASLLAVQRAMDAEAMYRDHAGAPPVNGLRAAAGVRVVCTRYPYGEIEARLQQRRPLDELEPGRHYVAGRSESRTRVGYYRLPLLLGVTLQALLADEPRPLADAVADEFAAVGMDVPRVLPQVLDNLRAAGLVSGAD